MDDIVICFECGSGLTWADTPHCHACEVEKVAFRSKARAWLRRGGV